MSNLFLHIGYPKTGTTGIQEFLCANRNELLEHDVLYPQTGLVRFSHHLFPWILTEDKRAASDLTKQEIFDQLKKEVAENTCANTLISSEGFVFATDPEELQQYFGELFDDIKLIIYLR